MLRWEFMKERLKKTHLRPRKSKIQEKTSTILKKGNGKRKLELNI